MGNSSADRERLVGLLLEEERRRRHAKVIPRRTAETSSLLPLSYAQERLWFLNQLGLVGAAYNVPMALKVQGCLNIEALERSFDELVRRHESLRTRFGLLNGEPYQSVEPHKGFSLNHLDLRHSVAPEERKKMLEECMEREQQHLFDLGEGSLFRVLLVALGVREYVLLVTVHHIVCDGWSLGVLRNELGLLYEAYSQGRSSPLTELSIQYADYAIWQREWLQGEVLQEQLQYWRQRLFGASPHLALPTDRPRPAVETFDGAGLTVDLPGTLTRALKDLALREEATLFMVLLGAFQALLSRWTGERDIVVGTPIAGRGTSQTEELIGFFVNTLVLRSEVFGDQSFRQLLKGVRTTALEAYSNQDVPFEVLVKDLHPERDLSRHPVFQVALVLRNYPGVRFESSEITWTAMHRQPLGAHFDLTLYLTESTNGLSVTYEYATSLFDRQTIERFAGLYRAVLDSIAANPDSLIDDISLLNEADKHHLLVQMNATAFMSDQNKLVHELFEDQAQRVAQSCAVLYGDAILSYRDLNEKADQLARYLRSQGVGPNELVAVCLERGPSMVVGLVAVLKAGGAYLPLDPNYPSERLAYMLEDANPAAVLTQASLKDSFLRSGNALIVLEDVFERLASTEDVDYPHDPQAMTTESLVYVIYTSGSTGKPKGTSMTHRSMSNLIEWHRRYLPIEPGKRVLQFAALSFDVAFQEIFSTLCMGGTVVMLDEWVRRDMRALMDLVSQHSIERIFLPPLVLQSLAEHSTDKILQTLKLRDIITAGEQLRITPQIIRFFNKLNGCRLHNHYGPTETHVVTTYTLNGSPDEWPSKPPIGGPISNTHIYILDTQLQPVPVGVVGDIYIGGACVAQGYLNRPDLTKLRFIRDAFSGGQNDRMYKTGDRGRWRMDGAIEYLGRNDEQVKIRGYRIELGEIEAQLMQHAYVSEVAVIAREEAHGENRLVAYVTPRDVQTPTADILRAHLKRSLPDFMVPSSFVVLDRMPKTPSGKLSRRDLPAPAATKDNYDPPRGDVEVKLAEIWQRMLGIKSVGREDSFFELGGHSLLVLKLLFEIESTLNCSLNVIDVYRSPSIAELGRRITEGVSEDVFVSLAQEARLDDQLVQRGGPLTVPAKVVMLTGSTGFVGRFLLAELLRETSAIIYCLVRAQSRQQAFNRLRQTLSKWNLWKDGFEVRLVALSGNLCLPRLGLDDTTYDFLCRNVDSIYHCATSMNHLETYKMAKAANVAAVLELLRIATAHKPKIINHISTLGIFGSVSDEPSRVVNEATTIDDEKHYTSRGYLASKWVAESLLLKARTRGIPCNIFRLGLVWADSLEGRFDEQQNVYQVLKSCLMSGYGIENYRYPIVPVPVDFVARATVALASRPGAEHDIFHISSHVQAIDAIFERCNEILGTSLVLVPYYDWICEMKRLHHKGCSLPAVPLIEFAFSMDRQTFYKHLSKRLGTGRIYFDCSRTNQALEREGLEVPNLDDDLLRVCIEGMLARDIDLKEAANGRGVLVSRSGCS